MAPAAPISARALGRATLARQGLLEPMHGTAQSAVARVLSLQAQHPEWPAVALAARAATAETADLAGALARRGVVRSSLMRITIHVVSATDLWPMFAICQPLRLAQWRLMARCDPVDSPLGRRLRAAHEAAMEALRIRPRSSSEVDRLLREAAGRSDLEPRLAWRHFAAMVPLVHAPHDREGYGRSLYAVGAEWLGEDSPPVDLGAARADLARRYLAAFGPATIEDLVAYVGRGRGGIGPWRDAVAALGDEVVAFQTTDGRTVLDLADAPRPPADAPAPPRLLARWDSLLLSHASRARDRVMDESARAAVFTKNADVRPSILVDGVVAGTWDLTRSDGRVDVVVRPLARLAPPVAEAVVAEAERILALVAADAEHSVALG